MGVVWRGGWGCSVGLGRWGGGLLGVGGEGGTFLWEHLAAAAAAGEGGLGTV